MKTEELRSCPFCGSTRLRKSDDMPNRKYRSVDCRDCLAHWHTIEDGNFDGWNTRPIEDALNARIAELDAEVTKGHELQDAYCDRIAELEAEIERFTVHSDIERQDDKSPNDTQTQTIVYGKECK